MTNPNDKNSLIDSIKTAGQSLTEIVGDFSNRLRDEYNNVDPATTERIRDRAHTARAAASNPSDIEGLKNAATGLATSVFDARKDFFGVVSRAVDGTRHSAPAEDMRQNTAQAADVAQQKAEEARATAEQKAEEHAPKQQSTKQTPTATTTNSEIDGLMRNLRGDASHPEVIDGEVVQGDDNK